MEFEIIESAKNQLITFLKIAQKYEQQVVIIPSKDKVDFKFIQVTRSVAGHLQFKDKIHINIKSMVDKMSDKAIEVNIKDMLKILSYVKNQIVSINAQFAKSDNDLLGLNFIIKNSATGSKDKEIQIPIFDNEQKVNFNAIKYDDTAINIIIPLSQIVDTISEIYEYETNELTISILNDENNQLIMKLEAFKDDNLRKKITIIKKQGEDFNIVKEQPVNKIESKFDTLYLKNLLMSGAGYEDLIITLQNNAPMSMVYSNQADSNLRCILAHRSTEQNE